MNTREFFARTICAVSGVGRYGVHAPAVEGIGHDKHGTPIICRRRPGPHTMIAEYLHKRLVPLVGLARGATLPVYRLIFLPTRREVSR